MRIVKWLCLECGYSFEIKLVETKNEEEVAIRNGTRIVPPTCLKCNSNKLREIEKS